AALVLAQNFDGTQQVKADDDKRHQSNRHARSSCRLTLWNCCGLYNRRSPLAIMDLIVNRGIEPKDACYLFATTYHLPPTTYSPIFSTSTCNPFTARTRTRAPTSAG